VLYLDSSVIVKLYLLEIGSDRLLARIAKGDPVFTSQISYAEVHAAFARKLRENLLQTRQFRRLERCFLNDWLSKLIHVQVDSKSMSDVPTLVRKYPLRGADAVHLAAALWLTSRMRLSPAFSGGDQILEFAVADKSFADIASHCGLKVFNPEHSI